MFAQRGIAHPAVLMDLQPFHPPRRQIGRGADTGLAPQNLEGQVGRLEGEGIAPLVPAADGKHLAAHLPHIGIAPLHHV